MAIYLQTTSIRLFRTSKIRGRKNIVSKSVQHRPSEFRREACNFTEYERSPPARTSLRLLTRCWSTWSGSRDSTGTTLQSIEYRTSSKRNVWEQLFQLRNRMIQKTVHTKDTLNFTYLQNLVSTQPRTSLVKFARSPRTDPSGVRYLRLVV